MTIVDLLNHKYRGQTLLYMAAIQPDFPSVMFGTTVLCAKLGNLS